MRDSQESCEVLAPVFGTLLRITNDTDSAISVSYDDPTRCSQTLKGIEHIQSDFSVWRPNKVFTLPAKSSRHIILSSESALDSSQSNPFYWCVNSSTSSGRRCGCLQYLPSSLEDQSPYMDMDIQVHLLDAEHQSMLYYCELNVFKTLSWTLRTRQSSNNHLKVEMAVFLIRVSSSSAENLRLSALLNDYDIGTNKAIISGLPRRVFSIPESSLDKGGSGSSCSCSHEVDVQFIEEGCFMVCTLFRLLKEDPVAANTEREFSSTACKWQLSQNSIFVTAVDLQKS